jgi:nucleotide-binding universal stress UspA family protein
MTKVLAAIDNSAAAKPVLATAAQIAGLYEADVEAVHVRQNGDRTVRAAADAAGLSLRTLTHSVVGALARAGRDEEVEAMVVGARGTHAGRRPAGHVALRLIVSLDKPVIVVPPEGRPATDLRRVLVPLDGTRETAAALDRVVRLARRHDLEVVVLHVRGDDSLPRFDDQPQHEADAWSEEFLARYCPDCDVRFEQRVGIPGEHVLGVAEETDADLIALGWSRNLSPGRAQVVREALDRSRVPVLLVGIPAD